MFEKAGSNGYGRTSDTYSLDKLAEELILKGVLYLGAGLGLCIALRLIKGLNSPTQSECIYVLLLNSSLCYNRAEKCSIKI